MLSTRRRLRRLQGLPDMFNELRLPRRLPCRARAVNLDFEAARSRWEKDGARGADAHSLRGGMEEVFSVFSLSIKARVRVRDGRVGLKWHNQAICVGL